jgi:ATP-binding cassette subfamily B protein
MTLGQLLAFAAFLGYLYPPVRGLAQLGLTIAAATAGAERLIEILDVRPAVADPARSAESRLGRPDGAVEVREATFRYPGADTDALRGLSFQVNPGELVIVTGPSGAGKSTVSKLLLRFYDPDAGSVLLDGVPVGDFPLARLREYVTLLPQETLVLHDTVRANIGCGRPGASDEALVAAARAADAHDFIVKLPDGYDTKIDPNSARLSGGQLQRLAIARAILRDAPVLVLDEPTTGLDAMAARRVIKPLRRLMQGRTTIMITHDLNLAPDADRILVVDRGRVVETGRHDELLARGGAYARLHGSQNNALMDTGELRLPLFTEAEVPVGGAVPVGMPTGAVPEGMSTGVPVGAPTGVPAGVPMDCAGGFVAEAAPQYAYYGAAGQSGAEGARYPGASPDPYPLPGPCPFPDPYPLPDPGSLPDPDPLRDPLDGYLPDGRPLFRDGTPWTGA